MASFGGRGKRPGKPANAGGGQFEIFIKSAVEKDATSRKVWVLDPNAPFVVDENGDEIPNWYNFEQHYDPAVNRSWPCACSEDAERCVGCEFPIGDEGNENDRGKSVRSTSSAYILPVIDEKGYVSLIQLGWGLWKSFCTNWKEYGKLNDAWYRITKDKAGGKTQYSATKTADTTKPEVKTDVPDDAYISAALGKRYLEAMERYQWSPDGEGFDDDLNDSDGSAAAGQEPNPADSQESADLGAEIPSEPETADWDQNLNAREASVGELKDWLDNIPADKGGPREYPKRPARPVLVGAVEKAQAEFDQPPY